MQVYRTLGIGWKLSEACLLVLLPLAWQAGNLNRRNAVSLNTVGRRACWKLVCTAVGIQKIEAGAHGRGYPEKGRRRINNINDIVND